MERNIKVPMDMRSLSEKVKEHYGLPPDAIYQGCEYDAKADSVTMQFKHQTFDMVKEPAVVEVSTLSDPGPEGSEEMSPVKKKK